MNKRFFIAWAAAFVVWMAGSFVVHGLLLHPDYVQLPNLFRTDADSEQYFPWMIMAHIVMAAAFVWIYARGAEAKPWLGQGLRYGVAVALLTVVPTYVIYFAVQPMPVALVAKQIVFDGVVLLILGAVVAFIYRDQRRV